MNFTDLNNIDGIQFMPVLKDKAAFIKEWQKNVKKYDYSNAQGCGIVCGSLSGNLEALDFDLKYDLTGKLMQSYIDAVNAINPNIFPKMTIQSTMSGGYHLIYRCSEIEGNLHLAHRPTTDLDRQKTYQKTLSDPKKQANPKNLTPEAFQQELINIAQRSHDNDNSRVLIETRGQGGYIACYPMPGYQMVQGSWSTIQQITPEERNVLFEVAYGFNSFFKEAPVSTRVEPKKVTKGLTPSEDYNERGDVVGLLESHGWTYVRKQGGKIIMRRPGETSTKTSGNYDEDKRWFSVFSTSTIFEAQKPYKPYAVFAMLECNGDYSQVTKKLAQMGYGDPLEKVAENRDYIPSIVDMNTDDDLSFLADDEDTEDYIRKWRDGSFELGLTTGIPELDKYFRFKRGNLVIGNGLDNVGKSSMFWYLLLLSSILHGWKHIIFTSENSAGAFKKKIIEFYTGKPISSLTDAEYVEANVFFKKHFRFIKNGEKLYNFQDIINLTKKTLVNFKADTLLIDPYNSLKVESKQTYEYHYEVASKLKLFGEHEDLCIYLNAHVGTAAAKRKDSKGFTLAPGKEDTEMGVMFANKADDFLTFHRLTDHETEFMYMELHVRKIKETETGGRPTPKSKPILFRPISGIVGFSQISEKSMSVAGFDAVSTHKQNKENALKYNVFQSPEIIQDLPPSMEGGSEAPF